VSDALELATLESRIAEVRRRIAECTDRPVRIVAVTKTHPWEVVELALRSGLVDVAENYAQELRAKADELAARSSLGVEPRWHFVGRLQSNKVRLIAPLVACWESVDRASVAAEIARRAPGARVHVQLDLAGIEGRGGCDPDAAPALVAQCVDLGLQVDGLMGVGAPGGPEAARPGFERLVALADELGLPERSIGMSGDFEVAVSLGATSVRLGSVLFGPRPAR
jgi:hypothetical protein